MTLSLPTSIYKYTFTYRIRGVEGDRVNKKESHKIDGKVLNALRELDEKELRPPRQEPRWQPNGEGRTPLFLAQHRLF